MSDRDWEDLPKGIGEHVINAVWVLGGSEGRSRFDLGASAIPVCGGDDNFTDGLSKSESIKVVEDEVLRAIGEVLNVEEVLHGMPDEGV